MASIEKRGASWRTYWRLGGTRDGAKQSTTWQDLTSARQAQKIAEAHRHKITDDDVYIAILSGDSERAEKEKRTPTVREFATLWLASRTRLAPGTAETYRRQLEREILPALGDWQLHQVTGTHIAVLLNDLRGRFKDSTVTRYYAVIHALFAYATVERIIDDNPARRTDFVRDIVAHDDTGEETHVYLEIGEFNAILAAADPRAAPLLQFLADTGCRFSEATAVQVGDVDLLSRPPRVLIQAAWKRGGDMKWYRGTTKGRTRRLITLPASAVDVLAPLVAGERGNRLVFRSPQGKPVSHSNFRHRVWEPAVDAVMASPIPLRKRPSLHDIRHSHVAWLLSQGRPLTSISRRLGHQSTAVTDKVYAGLLREVVEADATALDAMRARVGGAASADQTHEASQSRRS